MPCLMHSNGVTFLVGHNLGALFEAADDAVDSVVEVLLLDCNLVVACSNECRLVAHVGDVGSRETWSLP